MNRLAAFLVLVLGVCAAPARAALVYDGYPTGPGGLSIPYADPTGNTSQVYAGLIEFNYSGHTVLAMSDDYNARSNVGESWPMTLYTYADVQAGAPVRFTSAQYSRAAFLSDFLWLDYSRGSLRQYAELLGNGWFAGENMLMWEVMSSSECPFSSCNGDTDNFNWSIMFALASGGSGRDEYLIPLRGQNIVLGSGTLGPVVPVPPAFWLLGSGLVGLIGVARKKHKAPH